MNLRTSKGVRTFMPLWYGIRVLAFATGFGAKTSFPMIVLQTSSGIALLMVAQEWNQWNDLGVTSYPDLIPVNQTDKNKPILDLMSLHDIKYNELGKKDKPKLRPVVRGDKMHSASYQSTYSPTCSGNATRCFYSTAAASNKAVHGINVSAACLLVWRIITTGYSLHLCTRLD